MYRYLKPAVADAYLSDSHGGIYPPSAECLEKGDHDISYAGTGDTLDFYKWDLSKLDLLEITSNPNQTQGPLIFNLKNKPQATIRLSVTSKYGCLSDTASVLVKTDTRFFDWHFCQCRVYPI